MASFQELQRQRRDLLNELEELEEAVAELIDTPATTVIAGEGDKDDDDQAEKRNRHLAWLERQRAGLLVVLNETERALLRLDEPDR